VKERLWEKKIMESRGRHWGSLVKSFGQNPENGQRGIKKGRGESKKGSQEEGGDTLGGENYHVARFGGTLEKEKMKK